MSQGKFDTLRLFLRSPLAFDGCVRALAGLTFAVALPFTSYADTQLPAGFAEETVLRNLDRPVAVRFSRDGRVFVAEKSGLIKVFQGLSRSDYQVVADMTGEVYDVGERGLKGLALDPKFPATPNLYALYAYDPQAFNGPELQDKCEDPAGKGCPSSARLKRLTLRGNQLSPDSNVQEAILDNSLWCSQFPYFDVSTLAFGPDGALYVGVGDGANKGTTDFGQLGDPVNACGDPPTGRGGAPTAPAAAGGSLRAQALASNFGVVRDEGKRLNYNGTVLRINPANGNSLPDSPLANNPARGVKRIVAFGLRNPVGLAFRPVNGELWVADKGGDTYEEINRLGVPTQNVANFGWPCYDGPEKHPQWKRANMDICRALYQTKRSTKRPYFSYAHTNHVYSRWVNPVRNDETLGCGGPRNPDRFGSEISAMAFYDRTIAVSESFPNRYNGSLFFSDAKRKCIWTLSARYGTVDRYTAVPFATGMNGGAVDLVQGPGGLYYVEQTEGTVRRITWSQ